MYPATLLKWLLSILIFTTIPVYNVGAPSIPRDVLCIAATLHNETQGTSLRDARAVYDTILYRMAATNKDACSVVLEPHQFTGMSTEKVEKVEAKSLTRAWQVSKMKPVCKECGWFHNKKVKPMWKLKRVMPTDGHVYYKEK